HKNIWDGFLGSGSSLIAAEISGKNMYGIEYEEEYCQMIIERYLNFTGEEKIVINGQKVLWSEYKERVPNE
ncbi:DNA methyltransferase, partial [Sebaldella sp. S0638]|uniref:DNA methyltransferase n=1 Tax=Sebaldella sp. S0638 TaxID=2957809 RepID=UPI0020A22CD8